MILLLKNNSIEKNICDIIPFFEDLYCEYDDIELLFEKYNMNIYSSKVLYNIIDNLNNKNGEKYKNKTIVFMKNIGYILDFKLYENIESINDKKIIYEIFIHRWYKLKKYWILNSYFTKVRLLHFLNNTHYIYNIIIKENVHVRELLINEIYRDDISISGTSHLCLKYEFSKLLVDISFIKLRIIYSNIENFERSFYIGKLLNFINEIFIISYLGNNSYYILLLEYHILLEIERNME